MRLTGLLVLVVAIALPIASGLHDSGTCTVTTADPSTYNEVYVPLEDRRFYVYEEAPPELGTPTPVPGSGYLLGNGTAVWEEGNDIGGLQRGGCNAGISQNAQPACTLGDWFPPGCDQEWGPIVDPTTPSVHLENLPEGVPCLIFGMDGITDEHCGHGPDTVIV